jgi:hypothetical protein
MLPKTFIVRPTGGRKASTDEKEEKAGLHLVIPWWGLPGRYSLTFVFLVLLSKKDLDSVNATISSCK